MKLKTKHGLLIGCVIVGLGVIFITLSFSDSFGSREVSPSVKIKTDSPAVVINRKFGLPVDSFQVIHEVISRNEFLAGILQQYHTDPQTIAALVAKSRDIFDVRNIQAGNAYTVFCNKDSLAKACYFVYQPNPIDYVVYDLRDSVRIYTGKKDVKTHQMETAGVITNSLFETLDHIHADPSLAMALSKIYAWDIDFYSIQKGDWFKVIYDQQYVEGQPVGLGHIKAAIFNHGGEKYYAFYFHPEDDSTEGYYNENAKSLRKAFLKAPLKFFHITSRYTMRRFHPIQHRMKAHLGTDYAAPQGTPIMSTAAGVVIDSRYSQFNGNYVKVRHNGTYTTQYLHMSKRAVKVGQHVSQGQVIGYVGSTGLATGPHVCYRFWKNGKQVDPMKQHFPAAEPVESGDMPAFHQLVNVQKGILEEIPVDTLSTQTI